MEIDYCAWFITVLESSDEILHGGISLHDGRSILRLESLALSLALHQHHLAVRIARVEEATVFRKHEVIIDDLLLILIVETGRIMVVNETTRSV